MGKPEQQPYQRRITARSWAPYWLRGLVAIAVGIAIYHLALSVLDVHLQWFSGISTFNANWIVAMSLLPFGAGVVIGMIYGFGGKYVAHFPPAFYLLYQYQTTTWVPDGSHLLPWGLLIVFVILQMEFCAVGGLFGEILIRKRFSWDNPDFHRADSEALPEDEALERLRRDADKHEA